MKKAKKSGSGGQGMEEKALTATPHGGKGEMKTKERGTENGETLR
jgi:hypothetical protein